jgi:hypothetical protein
MVTTTETHTTISAGRAMNAARMLIADQLTDLVGAGTPWRMRSPLGSVWVVPLWISYPGHERPGTVGSVAVDEATGHVVSWTPLEDVLAHVEQYRERNAEAIAAGLEGLIPADTDG